MPNKQKSADKKPAMPGPTPSENLRRAPGPGHSPLWDHWPLIKAMRKARSTWAEIAAAIEEASGKTLKAAPSTICNFCRRIEDRKRRGKRPFPIGYEEPSLEPKPSEAAAARSSAPPVDVPPKESVKARYAKHQAAFVKKKAQQLKNEPSIPIIEPRQKQ